MKEQMIMLAIMLAVGVFLVSGLLVVPALEQNQQAEALGCKESTPAFNASKGRCLRG